MKEERSLDILADCATSVRAAFFATACLSVLTAAFAGLDLDLAFPLLAGTVSLSKTALLALFAAFALGCVSSGKAFADEALAALAGEAVFAAVFDADAFTACVVGALTTSGLLDFADLGAMAVRSFRKMDGVMTA